jgi:hypothetical protein
MSNRRYFATVKFISPDGSVVVDRADGVGRVFIAEREATLAGDLVVGDVVECSIMPGGVGVDVLLSRRARHLAAVQEAAG